MFDLVIKDAEIFDGSGAKPVRGDLGVTGGRIAAIGPRLGAAKETVKADGLALAPGIIDGHTHYDAQITWDPFVDPSPALGVTTAVLGNCGFTIAPCKPQDRDLTMRHLTHVEGMSLDALRAGIKLGLRELPAISRHAASRQGVGPNVACFAGHSAIRTFVMGEEATERTATDDEIAQDGRRWCARRWRPARSASPPRRPRRTTARAARRCRRAWPTTRSCARWCKAMGESGTRRLHADQGQQDLDPLSRGDRRRSQAPGGDRRPLPFQHQPDGGLHHARPGQRRARRAATSSWRRPRAARSAWISPSRARTCSRACRRGSRRWRRTIRPSSKKIYGDPSWRAAVRNELAERRGRLVFNSEWDKLFVVETAKEENRKLEGATLAEMAKQAGKDPLDCILDFALSEDLDTLFVAQLLHNDDKEVGKILADPNTHISLSRRRRPSHLLLRRRLRPASARPLEPRPRRARPAAGGASPDRPAGQAVRHPGPRPAARRLRRRPDAVRSRRPWRAAPSAGRTTCRPAPRGSPPARSACTASGSTARR